MIIILLIGSEFLLPIFCLSIDFIRPVEYNSISTNCAGGIIWGL